MRAAMLGLPSLFDKQVKTQRRNGRELISLLHYHLSVSQTLRFVVLGCWVAKRVETQRRRGERMSFYTFAGNPRLYSSWVAKRVETQRRRGERMSFYTFAGSPRLYLCWAAKRVETQRRRGERMSLLPLSRPIDRVWLRAGLRRESKPSEEGERE
jgi:hypothetical protein